MADGAFYRDVMVNSHAIRANARAIWKYPTAGLHEVCIEECDICATVTCGCNSDADCDDGDLCTTDECLEGECVSTPIECDDGLFCNGEETCDPGTGECIEGEYPCAEGETCDEKNDECHGWTLDGNLPGPVGFHGVAVVDGQIFVFGGMDGSPASHLADAYMYHPGGGYTWKAPLPEGRSEMGFVNHNGRVYCIAGSDGHAYPPDWGRSKVVFSYDPSIDSWATECSLTYSRDNLSGVSVGDYVYSIGGHHEDTGHGVSLSLVERLGSGGCPWEEVARLNRDECIGSSGYTLGRQELGAVTVDGKIYAIGGLSYEAGGNCPSPKTSEQRLVSSPRCGAGGSSADCPARLV